MKTKLYHFTRIENVAPIKQYGLIPHKSKGIMQKSDGLVYLTDSPKYIKIMAEEIARLDVYAVLVVDVSGLALAPIWWKGKGHHEWTYRGSIPKERILKIRKTTATKT